MAWREIIYSYDGSFDGLMCCIYESYTQKERPTAILCDGDDEPALFDVRLVATDREHARRVYLSFQRYNMSVGPFLRRVFLTCMTDKEMCMYRFIQKLYRAGAPLLTRLSDETYAPLLKAVRHMGGEVEALRGFVRFSEFSGILGAEIEPKNRILPILRSHFCDRYRNESFFIYDRTHREALLYSGGVSRIVPLEEFHMAPPDETEVHYRRLWKRFYDTIAIRERDNPGLRMSNMPKRYWNTMTEFQEESFFTPRTKDSDAALQARAAQDAISAPATPAEFARSAPV